MVREAIQEGQRLDVPGHRAFFGAKQREHRAAAEAEAEHKAELEAVLLEFEPDRWMRIRAQMIDPKRRPEETAAKAHGLPHGGRTNHGFSHFEPIFYFFF